MKIREKGEDTLYVIGLVRTLVAIKKVQRTSRIAGGPKWDAFGTLTEKDHIHPGVYIVHFDNTPTRDFIAFSYPFFLFSPLNLHI